MCTVVPWNDHFPNLNNPILTIMKKRPHAEWSFQGTTLPLTTAPLTTVLVIALILVGIALMCSREPPPAPETTRIDTIRITMPMPVDSMPVRTVTAKLALPATSRKPKTPTADSTMLEIPDSVEAEVPIVSKEYTDSLTYTAWVSGWQPSLDSIRIYQPRPIQPKPKHWHLGVTAGYAIGPRGFSPYVGIGITYSFVSF